MKLEFHYTFIIIALGFVLTGYFSNIIVFTSIIIIHELGHFLIAKLLGLNPVKIIIYPFGGITNLNTLINTPIKKELLVAISGFLFQAIYYFIIVILYKEGIIREYIFNEFAKYHYNILMFNMLPIYPLDGAKIINLFLSYYIPYKKTLYLNIIISIITGIIIACYNYHNFNYTDLFIAGILVTSTIKYSQNIKYYFNRFLLERYLYNIKYNKLKNITKISHMYRDKRHIIKEKDAYLTEKQLLKRYFKQNMWKMFD